MQLLLPEESENVKTNWQKFTHYETNISLINWAKKIDKSKGNLSPHKHNLQQNPSIKAHNIIYKKNII